jgi:hypothetical protein
MDDTFNCIKDSDIHVNAGKMRTQQAGTASKGECLVKRMGDRGLVRAYSTLLKES